jgi:hypothetical protein
VPSSSQFFRSLRGLPIAVSFSQSPPSLTLSQHPWF